MQIVARLILFKKGSHNFFAQVHTFQDNWQKRCDGRKPAAILVFQPSTTGIFENRFFFTKNLNFRIDYFRFWWIPIDQKKNSFTKLLQCEILSIGKIKTWNLFKLKKDQLLWHRRLEGYQFYGWVSKEYRYIVKKVYNKFQLFSFYG